MIILRSKFFSKYVNINDIINKLDKEDLIDYDISYSIPSDCISISADLDNFRIFIPYEDEFAQYDIDDFIREFGVTYRTKTVRDRNLFILTVIGGKINEKQFYKLLKFLITEYKYCNILLDKVEYDRLINKNKKKRK